MKLQQRTFTLILLYHILRIVSMSATNKETEQEHHFNAVYWEVEPYIYKDEHGKLAGRVISRLETTLDICGGSGTTDLHRTNVSLVKFVKSMPTYSAFKDYIMNNVSYSNNEETLWGPIITLEPFDLEFFYKLDVYPAFLETVAEMAVLVPHSNVSLHVKLFNGLHKLYFLLLLAFLLCCLTGTILWLLELRYTPKAVSKKTVRQLEDGVWWAFVTMSTVGYGDISPKRRFSRFAAVIWMYVALIVPCILTATTSSLIFGVDTFDIEGKTVGVLADSYESYVASEVYRTHNVKYKSYQELMDGVRRGDVFAGLVNADVAAWYQNEKWKGIGEGGEGMETLVVVDLLPANIDVYWLLSAKRWRDDLTECVDVYHKAQVKEAINREYYRVPGRKDLYEAGFADVKSLLTYQVVLVIAGANVLIVGLHALINRKRKMNAGATDQESPRATINERYQNNPTESVTTCVNNINRSSYKATTGKKSTLANFFQNKKNRLPNKKKKKGMSSSSDNIESNSNDNFPFKSDFLNELELATVTKERF